MCSVNPNVKDLRSVSSSAATPHSPSALGVCRRAPPDACWHRPISSLFAVKGTQGVSGAAHWQAGSYLVHLLCLRLSNSQGQWRQPGTSEWGPQTWSSGPGAHLGWASSWSSPWEWPAEAEVVNAQQLNIPDACEQTHYCKDCSSKKRKWSSRPRDDWCCVAAGWIPEWRPQWAHLAAPPCWS